MAHPHRRDRRRVTLVARASFAGQGVFDVKVIDLSVDGCQIETSVDLLPGSPLTLTVPRIGSLEAHVRWCTGGKAGLRFKPEAREAGPLLPRGHERVNLNADVSLRRTGKLGFRVRAVDVSPSGCKVDFVERPEVGERLWIKFDGFEALEGTVRWLDGFAGGIRFTTSIHAAVFKLMLARLQPDGRADDPTGVR